MEVKQSLKQPAAKQRIGLIATPKSGKTFAAATFSNNFDPTFSKPASLDDAFWFCFDVGGLDGLTEKRINIPHFDFTDMRGEKELDQGLKEAFEHVRKISGSIKYLVLDTVSALDRCWLDFAHTKYGKNFGMYDEILARHRRLFLNEVKSLPCHVLLLFHPKAKPETQKDNLDVQGFDYILDVSGNAANLYRMHLSLLSQVTKTEVKGKPDEWSLLSRGRGGVERFSRYACVAEREPADLKLLYTKIKTVMNPTQETKEAA